MIPMAAAFREPLLVVGGYGYRNVGDEAILAGLLHQLAGRAVTVVSRRPALTTAMHAVPSIPVSGAVAALGKHRSVIIGGGGLFGRDMGALGRLLPLYGLLARASSRQVSLRGVGIDPPTSVWAREPLRWLARSASEIVVRDAASRELLRTWGVDARSALDLSYAMPAAPPNHGRELLRKAGVDLRRPVVGLCLTAIDEPLARRVMAAVEWTVRALPEVEFVFIPFSRHPFVARHDDVRFGRALQARLPAIRVLEGSHHPAAVLSVVASLSAAVCMRYHSLLFADRSGVPIIAFPYAEKCRTWLSEHSQEPAQPVGASLTAAISAVLRTVRMAG